MQPHLEILLLSKRPCPPEDSKAKAALSMAVGLTTCRKVKEPKPLLLPDADLLAEGRYEPRSFARISFGED